MTLDLSARLDASLIEALRAAIVQAGRDLLAHQPSRALPSEAAMRQTFARAGEQVMQSLGPVLASLTPSWPVFQAGLTTDRLPASAGPYWLCDPLDGAIQYLAGLPLWTVTLTLMEGQTPCLAFVSDPSLGRTYHAIRQGGAFCDGVLLQCSDASSLALATVGTSFPNLPRRPPEELDAFLATLARVVPAVLAQRWIGSATLSLALVASGRLDGYWECGRHLADWLPGVLIAEEAGARVTAMTSARLGDPGSGVVASSPTLHSVLRDQLTGSSS